MYDYEQTHISENKKLLSDLINASRIQKDPRITSFFSVWRNCDYVGAHLYTFLQKNASYTEKLGIKKWLLAWENTEGKVEFFWDLGENTHDTIFWHWWKPDSQDMYDFFYTVRENDREHIIELLDSIRDVLTTILQKEQKKEDHPLWK